MRGLLCFFTGHRPSGLSTALTGGRIVYECRRCGGWLGDMFFWRGLRKFKSGH